MATIVKLPPQRDVGAVWSAVARESAAWLAGQGAAVQDTVLLLPFEQLLAPARRAWARQGGWMPRIETSQTLARSLAPPASAEALQLTFDAALDRLIARRLLRPRPWAIEWARRDAAGFDEAIGLVVQAAHEFARAAAAVAPTDREAHWAAAREALGVRIGPGERERLLARVALEWAATAATPVTDLLFDLKPSAWIVVEAGGPDPLVRALLASSPGGSATPPSLLIETDTSPDDPFATFGADAPVPRLGLCLSFEDEAQRCAAELLHHLTAGRRPIALVAQDRLLIRRVRALLSRQQIELADETGWKLSTTRVGASVMALLRAARPDATTDDGLDWIKASIAAWPHLTAPSLALASLESAWRKGGITRFHAPPVLDNERAATLWAAAQDVVAAVQPGRARPLLDWLDALSAALDGCGAWGLLASEEAGRQAMAALYLIDRTRVQQSASTDAMAFSEFTRWVDDALEANSYRPPAPPEPAVIVTPLERVMLRPFAAVVFPGCDAKRLGAAPVPHALLDDASATALGLPSAQRRRDDELLAFVQLLRLPHVSLLRRLDDGGEPLAGSPLVARWQLDREARGLTAGTPMADARERRRVAAAPVRRPLPVAPDLLPAALSASACEALRACPYRFFALRMLRLQEVDELDDALEKRDYGDWLHRVLHRFHATRTDGATPAMDTLHLKACAQAVREELQLDEAAFLPFAASFDRLLPHYVAWQQARDAEGARWHDGEVEITARPSAWEGTGMRGVIDRIDDLPGSAIQLIDYKTGDAQALRQLVKRAQEDTQLAFYAALIAERDGEVPALSAGYLPLDTGEEPALIDHEQVADTARRLIDGIAVDLQRLRAGAPLPALGEGGVCEHCEARGLCRRDHWAVVPVSTQKASR